MFPRPPTPGSEIDNAGGAYVRRRLDFGDRILVNGDQLTAEEIAAIPRANLQSLINLNLIELFPPPSSEALLELRAALKEKNAEIELLNELLAEKTAPPTASGHCFLMSDETGKKFHVIQGRQVTSQPLSRAQAEAKMKELTT